MPKINILDKHVAELIAAGEVVERPASVIKELVENSVDAGAKSVTVEIMGGGVSFMRVSDDGTGLAFSEAPKAFLRNATSKTLNKEDLESIVTMGFRGEALASVAAVSKIEMLTKRPEEKTGTLYRIGGGEEISHIETGCPDGTTIIIRELFYNTPARLKFLKKDISEANAVAAVVDKLVLAHPHISFRFIRDNKIVRITAGDGKLYSAIYSVFGKQFAASLVPVEFSGQGVKIGGFVSSPLFCRGNRTMQYFFVNSRPIKSLKIMAALEEAYKSCIPTGKYPACVLVAEIDPREVDVNVHPAKTEVRFSDENAVFDMVYFAVKNALLNAQNVKEAQIKMPEYRPALFSESSSSTEKSAHQQVLTPTLNASVAEFIVNKPLTAESEELPTISETPISEHTAVSIPITERVSSSVHIERPPPEISQTPNPYRLRIIGELWKTYIICEEDENLVMIDKHAAHERIRFEVLKKELTSSSQLLAESIFMTFDMRCYDALRQGREVLLDSGIEIIPLDNYVIEIIALPAVLTGSDVEAVLHEVAEIFAESNGSEIGTEGIFNEVLHRIACKSSMKAGDKSLISDLETLANTVWNDKSIRFCPHGRPIITTINRREIEKNFGRA
ncbi:MAG: DNA mismatch repair endonuclease MutL [Oscillospiraceae bacterium]|nr:DNA mismatch repair endonuclease MutL [Oscillospiraceae bacterium]